MNNGARGRPSYFAIRFPQESHLDVRSLREARPGRWTRVAVVRDVDDHYKILFVGYLGPSCHIVMPTELLSAGPEDFSADAHEEIYDLIQDLNILS